MELLKLLSTNEIVAQVIAFLLLLWILRTTFWGKVLGMLDARKEKIASELKAIEATKAEVNIMKAQYEEHLTMIEKEAEAKFQEAADKGKDYAEEMRKKAEAEGERIIQNAKENIRGELTKAKEELKDSIVDLTIRAAEKVIEEKLSESDDRKLVEDFLRKIEKQ
jgi:F-type H+-transporting ATPase subunit b